jgi:hypothetical protein
MEGIFSDPEPLGELPAAYSGRSCAVDFTVGGYSPENPCGAFCTPENNTAWRDAARDYVARLQTGPLAHAVAKLKLGPRVATLANYVEGITAGITGPDTAELAAIVQELRCIEVDALAAGRVTPPPPPPSIGPPAEPTDPDSGWTMPSFPSFPTLPSWPTLPSFGIPDWAYWAAGGLLAYLVLRNDRR